MDQNNTSATPATDDQELAKVLAGMNEQTQALGDTEQPAADAAATAPDPATLPPTTPGAAPAPAADPMQYEPATLPAPAAAPTLAPVSPDLTGATAAPAPDATPAASPELENLKKDALEELRPLVDKLDLQPQEKFDTLLLIIRSTDDQGLLTAAHEAAKAIEDETKRAQALLDVIKEIDFFSAQKTA